MRGRRIFAALCIAALCVGASAGPACAGDVTPRVRHRDPTWKFSILLFEEWKAVPIPPLPPEPDDVDKHLVARFHEPGRRLGVNLPNGTHGICEILVVGPSDTAKVETVLRHAGARHGIKVETEFGEAIKTKDGVPGTSWHQFPGPQLRVEAATWNKDGVQLGVWMAVGYTSPEEWLLLERVLSSVLWSDERAGPAAGASTLDGLKLTPERRRAIERGLVKGWNLLVSPAKQYVVVYNTKGGKNNRLAQVVGERIETIRKQQYEVLFPHPTPIEATSVVRICADAGEYWAYGGPRGTAGYWNAADEELVFFDQDPSRVPDDETISVLYHEAFHQYVFYAAGRVAPHSWFNEGHGDYFAGAKFKDRKFRIEPFVWRLDVMREALGSGPGASPERKPKGHVPISRLVQMTRAEYYAQPSLCYAEGWSLVYFLRAIVPTKPEWNAKWGKILDTYFRELRDATARLAKKATPKTPSPTDPPAGPPVPRDDKDPAAAPPAAPETEAENDDAVTVARKAAFADVDLDELEAAWKSSIVALLDSLKRRR